MHAERKRKAFNHTLLSCLLGMMRRITKVKDYQDALHTPESYVDDLRKSSNEFTNRLKAFENPLCKLNRY